MLARAKMSLRIAFAVLAMLLAQVVSKADALAHAELGGISVFALGVVPIEGSSDAVELHLLVVNGTSSAATLRGLDASGATKIVIQRQRKLLGKILWQSVKFLRLEPGEDAMMVPPDYRILIETKNPSQFLNEEIEIQADFGPLGKVVIEGTE